MTNTNNYPYPIHQKSGSSTNSFLLGLIVGVLLTLLFTTKKGRKLLHSLTEEGWHKFSDVEDILHAMEDDEEGYIDDEMVEEVMETSERPTHVVEEAPVKPSRVHPIRRITSGRKFFRKPARK